MRIKLASITVDDQTKALHFYTTVLGFTKQTDITNGPFRWLTVSSPDGVAGVELVLEPMGFPPAGIYQKARFEGMPLGIYCPSRHRIFFQVLQTVEFPFLYFKSSALLAAP